MKKYQCEFKEYDEWYSVDRNGNVFSKYKNGLLKHYIDKDGYHRVDIHGKHMKIHKLVYLTWKGRIPKGMQINHFDDNKDNNSLENLYIGTQKDNISDCKRNNHRIGNKKSIVVFDKNINKTIKFDSIKSLIIYTGHSNKNGSLSKFKKAKWFNDRYLIIEEKV